MASNYYFINIVRFILLVLAQVLICNRIGYLGYINPMIYILFLYWYPVKQNRAVFLIIAFLLGFTVDVFSDSLAIHTAATVTIAYLRPTIMRFCFGVNFDFQSFKISGVPAIQKLTYLTLLIVIHHTIFFTLEVFNFDNILLILKKIIIVSIASTLICVLLSSLFSVKKE
ncbi:rod shape-determining protein MreD [Cellulophaga sp. HaHaR_3_176]|uniref:rod shape-determining protein MreD n=1 Tax=Cellulophaga sp. HaHaR_3_176 TaxID=1942464 RepID=UPI001C1F3B18|nr:rod shape-determining protein MreD [Cellulophaga sp. HaHaR_3_176]QWX83139.1 rod shape-determining protein MreD [Cellulophaga sp. HaHaR_3_176]